MFLKMYTGLSCLKLMEQTSGNMLYQMYCDVIIDPTRPLTNYKLLDDIMLELAGKLKIQQLQDILAEQWKPYMQNLDTLYTDATCYESEMRYPTDQKLFSEDKKGKDLVRKELARVRATAMEGSFGKQKENYDLRRVKARTKLTEILYLVHLLRHTHGKRGAADGQNRTESIAGSLLKRKHAHRKVLSQGDYVSVMEN